MHTTKYRNVTVFHNGDRRGPITLLLPATQVVMRTDGLLEVTVDAALLQDFVADRVRRDKIAALEAATPEQILAGWLG